MHSDFSAADIACMDAQRNAYDLRECMKRLIDLERRVSALEEKRREDARKGNTFHYGNS